MKSPWKFLARLASLRPSAKAQESSVGTDADSKALESEVEPRSAIPHGSTVTASPPADNEDVSVNQGSVTSDKAKGDDDVAQALKPLIDAEETPATARHEAEQSGAEDPKSEAIANSQNKPLLKGRERGKGANGRRTAQSAVAIKNRQNLQPSSPRDLFFHEVAILDEEIKMLRTQLAQKLHLQNVQLKKMLDRFDVS
ncbi:hypothetical protein [Sinorhizobium alkalisoli]|uniref:hypothetical protein n=1 Tax=Sinorhizobium alkalisoli TaxID=1752398 RepID=UPI00124E5E0E|nr:hypothetical protein [Sinorhizobium alkalisoli]MCG5480929.1 hypothetical protein [Sinorhizobium alkalisoli]